MIVLLGIQARANSTRLPNKVLADIHGKSMLERVYDQCMDATQGLMEKG